MTLAFFLISVMAYWKIDRAEGFVFLQTEKV